MKDKYIETGRYSMNRIQRCNLLLYTHVVFIINNALHFFGNVSQVFAGQYIIQPLKIR